jgi:hypothetical protein
VRLDSALWRALAVYRAAALLYAVGSALAYAHDYRRPQLAAVVLAPMAVWTALAGRLYSQPRRRGRSLLAADLAVTVAALLASRLVLAPERITARAPTLTVSWATPPVIACAVALGWAGGTAAGDVVGLLLAAAGAVLR